VKETPKENRRLMSNNPPSVPYRNMTNILINNTYNQKPCNTHALCGVCVNDDGELDDYCYAFLFYYSIKYTTTYNAALFWYIQPRSSSAAFGSYSSFVEIPDPDTTHVICRYNVHFWCMSEVLDAIEDGTFVEKVESGEIPSNNEIETAWTNHQAIEKFGTWHVPTDDNYTYPYYPTEDTGEPHQH